MLKANQLNKVSLTNLMMAGLIGVLLIYYVVVANSITTWDYKIKKLSEQLFSLGESGSSLIARQASMEDSGLLVNFAKNHSMVEARNILYLFENRNVALGP